jgi:NAD(P)-dependent dehydrogenase (short-subunit alcohol dehydrogenase family)
MMQNLPNTEGGAAIINTASVAAFDGQDWSPASPRPKPVSLDDAAIAHFASHGIRVVAIAPGVLIPL